MRKLIVTTALLSLVLLNPVAWADDASDVQPSKMVQAKPAEHVVTDSKKTIMVSKDNPRFTISLPSNATTGYYWYIAKYDPRLIKLVDSHYSAPKKAMPGQGGIQVWYFEARHNSFKAAYLSDIELVYARPWDLANKRVHVFHVATR